VNPKDMDLRIEDHTLYLKGQRKSESEEKKENYRRLERAYGSFTRAFRLPDSVDAEKVSARYQDGVLTVTLPKREELKPKKVKVSVN
ncbi:MAG: Hsp20/alpha crystallin family protein, partial [Candidatus Binatia bacterium]